jgi:hypothetical protein
MKFPTSDVYLLSIYQVGSFENAELLDTMQRRMEGGIFLVTGAGFKLVLAVHLCLKLVVLMSLLVAKCLGHGVYRLPKKW